MTAAKSFTTSASTRTSGPNRASAPAYAATKAALAARIDAHFDAHHILAAGTGNARIIGTAADETLNNARSDQTLVGGGGDDVYVLANETRAHIIERPGGGLDTIVFDAAAFAATAGNPAIIPGDGDLRTCAK